MSFAYPGLTHCEKCFSLLNMSGRCESCDRRKKENEMIKKQIENAEEEAKEYLNENEKGGVNMIALGLTHCRNCLTPLNENGKCDFCESRKEFNKIMGTQKEEEKKATEWLYKKTFSDNSNGIAPSTADTILNLIEKQQQELELKDKVIDEMAELLALLQLSIRESNEEFEKEYCDFIRDRQPICYKNYKCRNCIKQYFINKVKENK